jgi:hypothetical protein
MFQHVSETISWISSTWRWGRAGRGWLRTRARAYVTWRAYGTWQWGCAGRVWLRARARMSHGVCTSHGMWCAMRLCLERAFVAAHGFVDAADVAKSSARLQGAAVSLSRAPECPHCADAWCCSSAGRALATLDGSSIGMSSAAALLRSRRCCPEAALASNALHCGALVDAALASNALHCGGSAALSSMLRLRAMHCTAAEQRSRRCCPRAALASNALHCCRTALQRVRRCASSSA